MGPSQPSVAVLATRAIHPNITRRDPTQFSDPDAVIHIDRVYVPETQPDVKVVSVDLKMADGSSVVLMRDGEYAVGF